MVIRDYGMHYLDKDTSGVFTEMAGKLQRTVLNVMIQLVSKEDVDTKMNITYC